MKRFTRHLLSSPLHPNSAKRKRSQLACKLAATLPTKDTQIIAIIVTRYHNTEKAFRDIAPLMQKFGEHRDINELRKGLRLLYTTNGKKVYFSGLAGNQKDGRRGKPSNMTLAKAVLWSLEQWWQTAQMAAGLLEDPMTTPEMFYADFLRLFP